ncbi:MAG: hypothetical protein JSR59_12035 [Proteobacteria bacterium]|nr:hypothetical protein [Pseudomonadota bacterium]
MESKLRRKIEKYYSGIVSDRRFVPIDDPAWEAMMRGLGKKFVSQEFRIQFVLDRGTLSVYGGLQNGVGDWFNLVNVISWLNGGRILISYDDPSGFAVAFDRSYQDLAKFFSQEEESIRGEFIDWESRRF